MTSKKILITGATGFIGKNLTATLLQKGYTNLYLFDRENTQEQLEEFCTDADFVFHLAGVNRPVDVKEFYEGNTDFSATLLKTLKEKGVTILYISHRLDEVFRISHSKSLTVTPWMPRRTRAPDLSGPLQIPGTAVGSFSSSASRLSRILSLT